MKNSALSLLLGATIVCAGCTKSTTGSSSPSGSGPEKKADNSRSTGKNSHATRSAKKGNPLVGKWTVTKSNKHWSENVSKQAIVEFLGDGETPSSGTMTITNNNNIETEADYMWQGDMFVFQAKFTRPDGSKNGYGAQVKIEKITDNEIVADVFSLKRLN